MDSIIKLKSMAALAPPRQRERKREREGEGELPGWAQSNWK